MTEVGHIDLKSPSIAAPAVDPRFEQMEDIHNRVKPHLDGLAQIDSHPHLDNATDDAYEEIIDLTNEIRAAKGMEPLVKGSTIRSLHALLVRIAELTEKHIFQRKENDQKKKEDILEENTTISNWTRRQGYANFGSGVVYPFLLLLGAQTTDSILNAIKTVKDIVPTGARGLENLFESLKQKPQFEQSMYLQTASSERQAIEGLKNMPRELQQKLMQMLRQELEAIRISGQR